MKKNEIFTFTAPNGVEVTAVVIEKLRETNGLFQHTLLCYAQNRIFTYIEKENMGWETNWEREFLYSYGKVLVDYCILPEYDAMLKNYYRQQDRTNNYADREL